MNISSCIFDGVNGQSFVFNTPQTPLNHFETSVATRRETNPRVAGHGNWPVKTWKDTRTFHFEGQILAANTSEYMQLRMTMMGAIQPAPELGYFSCGTLRMVIDGIGEEIQSACDIDMEPEMAVEAGFPSAGDYVVDLIAPDPIMYGSVVNSFITGTPSGGSGGLTFPMTFPITFQGTGTGGDILVTNVGNSPAYPTVTIYGPCSSPSITIIINGVRQTVGFDDLSLSAGEYVVLNFDTSLRTATTGDGSSVYHKISNGSSWWSVPRGTFSVVYAASDASSPSHAEIKIRNAYNI